MSKRDAAERVSRVDELPKVGSLGRQACVASDSLEGDISQ
jgi:hypothetical protein